MLTSGLHMYIHTCVPTQTYTENILHTHTHTHTQDDCGEGKDREGQRKARGEMETQRSTPAAPAGSLMVTLTFGHSECAAA